jgi:hypothetical protein
MVFDRVSKTMVFEWQKVKDHGLGKPCTEASFGNLRYLARFLHVHVLLKVPGIWRALRAKRPPQANSFGKKP